MILLDNELNGYRQYILPMACENEVLRRAVSVAATAHLSPNIPELDAPGKAGRSAIITKLVKDASEGPSSQLSGETIWATIILLLVSDLVTGSEDFSISYRMLVSFTQAKKDSLKDSPLKDFLMEQTELYGYCPTFHFPPLLIYSLASTSLHSQ